MSAIQNFMAVYRQLSFIEKIVVIKRSMVYVIKKYLLGMPFTISKVNNYKMTLDLTDNGIARSLAIFGTREGEHKHILKQELKPGMTVLDLGANIGYYTLMMKKMQPSISIYAVEPEESNYYLLNDNLTLNNCETNVYTENIAISDKDGIEKLYLSELSNVHTLLPNDVKNHMTGDSVEIKTKSLLTFIKECKTNIDLVRMDIEGYETKVLNNLVNVVNKKLSRPSVLFELHPDKYTTKNSINVPLKKLFKLGYKFKILASSHTEEFTKLGYTPLAVIPTDGTVRYVYYDIKNKDALELLKISRTALLDGTIVGYFNMMLAK